MTQPKIKIELDANDKMIEVLGWIGVAFLIIIPLYFYNNLPDKIPSHFGANGKPDAYSGKNSIWLLPIIGTLLYVGLAKLNQYPHTFNYATKITAENAAKQYQIATKMIRYINTLIVLVFVYITYATIQTALERQNGLGNGFIILFLTLLFGTIGYFLYKSLRDDD